MIYQLHFRGGARDGAVVNSLRPYDATQEEDGVYAADKAGEACLEYVDDWTRRVVLAKTRFTTLAEFLEADDR